MKKTIREILCEAVDRQAEGRSLTTEMKKILHDADERHHAENENRERANNFNLMTADYLKKISDAADMQRAITAILFPNGIHAPDIDWLQ